MTINHSFRKSALDKVTLERESIIHKKTYHDVYKTEYFVCWYLGLGMYIMQALGLDIYSLAVDLNISMNIFSICNYWNVFAFGFSILFFGRDSGTSTIFFGVPRPFPVSKGLCLWSRQGKIPLLDGVTGCGKTRILEHATWRNVALDTHEAPPGIHSWKEPI